jgi:hypothetical protein
VNNTGFFIISRIINISYLHYKTNPVHTNHEVIPLDEGLTFKKLYNA